MTKHTIAYWIRKFGFTVDLWNVFTNTWGRASLYVSVIHPKDKSEHEFYF